MGDSLSLYLSLSAPHTFAQTHNVKQKNSLVGSPLVCLFFGVAVQELDEALGELGVADFAVLVSVEVNEDNVRVFVSDGQARAEVPQLFLHDVSLACGCGGGRMCS